MSTAPAIAPPAPPRQAQQFARFLARESASWVRPAAAVLAAEGERAARAYEQGGEAAALASVENADWLRYLDRVWLATVPRAGELVRDELTPGGSPKSATLIPGSVGLPGHGLVKAAPPDPFVQAAVQWLRLNAGDRVQGISQTSRDEIGNQIRIGTSKGESRDQIAGRIVKHRRSITPGRAQTIARTEVHAAANYGSLVAADTAAVPMYKIWISFAGARDTHVAAAGQRRSLDVAFIVGGFPLAHPGDSTMGAPGEITINCRCVMVFEARRPRRRAA